MPTWTGIRPCYAAIHYNQLRAIQLQTHAYSQGGRPASNIKAVWSMHYWNQVVWFVDSLVRTSVTTVLFQSLTYLSWIKSAFGSDLYCTLFLIRSGSQLKLWGPLISKMTNPTCFICSGSPQHRPFLAWEPKMVPTINHGLYLDDKPWYWSTLLTPRWKSLTRPFYRPLLAGGKYSPLR